MMTTTVRLALAAPAHFGTESSTDLPFDPADLTLMFGVVVAVLLGVMLLMFALSRFL